MFHGQSKQQGVFTVGGAIFNQRANAAVLRVQQAGIRHAVQRGRNIVFTQLRQDKTDFTAGIKLSLYVSLKGRMFARHCHRGQRHYP